MDRTAYERERVEIMSGLESARSGCLLLADVADLLATDDGVLVDLTVAEALRGMSGLLTRMAETLRVYGRTMGTWK